ncbi:hypothetical protein BSQ33_08190 [Vibrio gazogenes]|uniref:Transmembrane protein n=1 Tax=Vibrio gazogenes TaxID=687 RepID=A0A1Z2SES2_VIBGA|nr:hypothetical protein BSQ33_08190 [Vibrio gazogenes]
MIIFSESLANTYFTVALQQQLLAYNQCTYKLQYKSSELAAKIALFPIFLTHIVLILMITDRYQTVSHKQFDE